jgi:hypothetical protein
VSKVASVDAPNGAIQDSTHEGMDPAMHATAAPAAKAPPDLLRLKIDKSCSRGLAGWLASSGVSLAIS